MFHLPVRHFFLTIFFAFGVITTSINHGSLRADTTVTFGSGSNQFDIVFSIIGDPENSPDTVGWPNPHISVPVGSVGYAYRISKYEVSRDMVRKASEEGGLGITLPSMDFLTHGPRPNMPVTGVCWNEAARFVNWLNTSQGFFPAYKFAIQPGEIGYNPIAHIERWQPGDLGYNPENRFRNSLALYFLPSLDEWYKAAYYDPSANGGQGSYWIYTTGSNNPPTPVSGGTQAGTAVFHQPVIQGPADIDNAGGLSPYGVMALGGNVWELQETTLFRDNDAPDHIRIIRGSDFSHPIGPDGMMSTYVYYKSPTDKHYDIGFRIASRFDNIPAASLVASQAVHSNWSGSGSPIDNLKSAAKQGLGVRTLTEANLINPTSGINGIVFDIKGFWNPSAVSLQDFRFQMSPQGAFSELINPLANWQEAPSPSEISVTEHPDQEDVTRIIIRWQDSQIMNRWLRATIRTNANTGLMFNEVYYLGHLLGETTGPEGSVYTVSFSDITLIRQAVGTQVDASSIFDIDKNGIVTFSDISAMRSQVGTVLTTVWLTERVREILFSWTGWGSGNEQSWTLTWQEETNGSGRRLTRNPRKRGI
jgi:sulfatase modifying factor 1